MRGGTLPAALIFAALGFALSFAPRRFRAPALLVAAIAALVMLQIPLGPSHTELVYFACWACVIAAAASVHLPGGVPGRAALLLALVTGAGAGAVVAQAGGLRDLAAAMPAASVIVPASWFVATGRGIAVKVVSSWLIAIAILAAALPLTPTPGYAPDHME